MSLLQWIDIAGAGAMVGLALHWALERSRLHAFVSSLGPLPSNSVELALALAGRLANGPHRGDDPPYLAAFLAPLGATPSDVIRHGGCCSGSSRLYMLALGVLGIRANQVTVYHRSRQARHCLVEVHLHERVLIADPVYGVFYTDTDGRTLSLEDLRAGTQVECRPIHGTTTPGYPSNDYYDFDFTLTKTANWTKSWQRRLAYSLLHGSTHGAIDRFRIPQLLEWPQTLLALTILFVLVFTHTIVLLAGLVSAT